MVDAATKILVVSSDKDDLNRLKRAVKLATFDALPSATGAAALKAFDVEKSIGFVIIGKGLSDVKIATLSKDLRELAKDKNRHIYIIMVTEDAKWNGMLGALSAGVDDFIAEPYDDETLVARIEVGTDILDGLEHGASRFERHNLVAELMEEHKFLIEMVELLDFVDNRLETGLPRAVTEWCLSAAFLIDFDVHVAKETVYIDRFLESVARTQADWFTDISRESFKTLQEQHTLLEKLAVGLKEELAKYIKIRAELEPILAAVSKLELSMQIGDRDDELEISLANVWAKVQGYYSKRRRLIAGLRKSIKGYVEFIPEHFRLEEEMFFPFSMKYLSEDDMGMLAGEFKRIEERAGLDRIKNEKKKIRKMSGLLKNANIRELKATAETL